MTLLSLTTAQQTLPGCQDKCGNVTVPYPFGLIGNSNCYRPQMDINCNHSFNPPKLFLSTGIVEVLDISLEGHLRINNWIGWDCYKDGVPTNRFESGGRYEEISVHVFPYR
ncbi:hypothetical protein HHK36_031701 [Tetracentron sinense]|uniref:Wall-associated receptor kinase galacturonan-binding domain-containing protein n=1 Tax=Tetracentron sinense TaxID=13715 RepID=A0A835CYB5_TETSI|nr:hypothetical protein HHK36_031701 [Tetracentron sinense]